MKKVSIRVPIAACVCYRTKEQYFEKTYKNKNIVCETNAVPWGVVCETIPSIKLIRKWPPAKASTAKINFDVKRKSRLIIAEQSGKSEQIYVLG